MGCVNNEPDNDQHRPDSQEQDAIDRVMGSEPLRVEESLSIPSDEHHEASSTPQLSNEGTSVSELEAESNPESIDRADVIGEGARWFAGWCLRFLIVCAAAYVAAIALGKIWSGVLPVLLALLISTVLYPPAAFLVRHKWPRSVAAVVSIVGTLAIAGGILALIAPTIQSQIPELRDQFTAGVVKLQKIVQGPPFNVKDEQLLEVLDKATAWLQQRSGDIANTVFQGISVVSNVAVTLVITLILTFFFIKDGQDFLPWVRKLTGRRLGWHLTEVLTRSWNTLSGYIRTQALVSFIDAIFIGIGLYFLKVPLAFALAVITFFAGFIPIVGAFAAGFIAVVVALVAVNMTAAILTLLLIIAVQQIEGNILSPMLQSRAMNLHAAIVLLAITLGGGLFGIIGAFLAVPVAAMIAVWLRYLGDMTDLRTGDKTAADIKFATDAGSLSGLQIEAAGRAMRDRLTSLRIGSHSPDDSDGKTGTAGDSSESAASPKDAEQDGKSGAATRVFSAITDAVTSPFKKK